jgi:hypothetical protein
MLKLILDICVRQKSYRYHIHICADSGCITSHPNANTSCRLNVFDLSQDGAEEEYVFSNHSLMETYLYIPFLTPISFMLDNTLNSYRFTTVFRHT